MARSFLLASGFAIAALIGAPVWAQVPPPPKVVHEKPALGGEPQTKPGPTPIGLRANEVQLSRLENASLIRPTAERLGRVSSILYHDERNQIARVPKTIGTITTALFDPARQAITYVGVTTGKRNGPAAVPWSAIRPIHQPNDQFTTAMTPKSIAAAPPLSRKEAGSAIDVETSLIGRPVAVANGKQIGSVSDVVAEIKSGKVDYIVVNPSGLGLGSLNSARAVPLAKLKPIGAGKSQPITLRIDDKQFTALPAFHTSKAQETAATRAIGKKVGATEQPPP